MKSNTCAPLLFLTSSYLALISVQNQAEAHYKGHKHARKLKAMEAQKNRQRRTGEASSAGRERDRDRDRDRERDRDKSKTCDSEAPLPALMDTSLMEGTSKYTDRQMGWRQLTLFTRHFPLTFYSSVKY